MTKYKYKIKKCVKCGRRTSSQVEGVFICKSCQNEVNMSLEKELLNDGFEYTKNNNSVRLNLRNEKEDKIMLYGLGDVHIGSNESNHKRFLEDIEMIKKDKYARVILMGDLLDCATKKSVGAGTFQNNMNPHEQYEYMLKTLEPIKDKIYGVHQGNHEERIFNETGINLSKIMANQLGTRYLGYGAFHKIKVRDNNYTIYSTHGSSCATLPHTKIKRCLDLATFIDVDIYMMGHVHQLQCQPQEYRKIDLKNKQVIKDKKFFILTGHYLNWDDSYAEMKSMRPSSQGCARVRLEGKENKKIYCSI